MTWSHFLVVSRWQNVFIVWLMQTVLYYKYVREYCEFTEHSFSSFLTLIAATGVILASGNIFNDIQDISSDALHTAKPKLVGNEIPVDTAWRWYYILNGLAMVLIILGAIRGWTLWLPIIFLSAIPLLYVYSRYLKNTILVGNILIAFLCALAVWITALLAPECTLWNHIHPHEALPIIFYGYIINAFLITLLREVVKDKEDASADIEAGIQTVGSLSHSVFRLIFNGILVLLYALNIYGFILLRAFLTPENWNLGLIFVFLPLIIITIIFNLPHKPKIYSFLSKLIKVYILFAILLLILWQR